MTKLLIKTVKEWKGKSGQAIADEIKTFYKDDDFDSSEERSWKKSLPELVKVIDKAGLGNLNLAVEFLLPINGKRVDAVLLGNRNEDKAPLALIIELKQWSWDKIEINGDKILVKGNNDCYEDDHPIFRTEEYFKILENNFTNVNNGQLKIAACQYLHNFDWKQKKTIFEGDFEKYKDKADRMFCKGEETDLESYIKNLFISSEIDDCAKTLLENGEFCYSQHDIEIFEKIKDDPKCITLMEDQKPIKERIEDSFSQLFNDKLKKRQMILISGAAGSGKTYAGLYIISRYCQLARERKRELKFAYTMPSSQTLRAVIKNYLEIPFLNSLGRKELIVIDEAHRFDVKSFQDLENIEAKIIIVLQDDRQRVLPKEVGTRKRFESFAEKNDFDFLTYVLKSQKRSGLGNYVNKVDNLLYGDEIKNPKIKSGIEIKICDTLSDFEEYFEEKHKELQEALTQTPNREKRISIKYLAPLCWPSYGKEIQIIKGRKNGKDLFFEKHWHPKNNKEGRDNTLFRWVLGLDNGVQQVGSVFNAQGLEFDYVALIWWKDLKWDKVENDWIINFNEIQYKYGYSDEFKKSDSDEDKAKKRYIMLNTYRVLLTRAKKGIFIWFNDEDTKEHFKEVMEL